MKPIRLLALALATMTAMASATLTAPAAHATAAVPVVVDLPAGVRALPRGVWPIGRTDDGHTVFDAESEPLYKSQGFTERRIVAADGSVATLDAGVESVVGDRLVQTHSDTSVTSRLVTESSWTTQSVPAGYTVLDFTADGIVVRTGSGGAHQLGLVAWGSNSVLGFTGAPAGISVFGYAHPVHDASWAVLSASIPGGSANGDKLVVDTAARKVRALPTGNPDCPSTGYEGLTVNENVLVWSDRLPDLSWVLCTTPLPAPADAAVAATTDRPMPRLADGIVVNPNEYRLVPVGSDVVVSAFDAARTWGTAAGEAITAVAPDGSTRTLATSGHGAIPGAPGHVLAVTGSAPGLAGLRSVDVATGSSTSAMPIAAVDTWYSGIAVDGTTVVYADDSAALGGARRRTVDFAAGTAGAGTLLDDDVTAPVATGQGVAAWSKSGYQGKWSTVLQADGTRITGNSYQPQVAEQGWTRFNGGLMRLPAGTYTSLPATAAFQDGVTYRPGSTVSAAANAVVATDVMTNQTRTIPVPECSAVGDLQVAGSWLLMTCPNGPTHYKFWAVDGTGAVPTRAIASGGTLYLGNGFALLRDGSGNLTWTSLSGATIDWQPLGTATATGDEAPYSVAVSRGSVPTVAWFSGRTARAALLPVTTSPLPTHPGALGAPPAPTGLTVTFAPSTGEATVTWAWGAAAGTEAIASFSVDSGDTHLAGLAPGSRSVSLGVPPAGTRSVQVVAQGASQSSSAQLAAVTFPGPTPTIQNTSVPLISGTPQVGVPVTASSGGWSPVGTYAYQWYADGVLIPGATAKSFTPAAALVSKSLTVTVTAAKIAYNPASATSQPSAAIAPGYLYSTNMPTILGTPRVGVPLRASGGTWNAPSTYTYQWSAGDSLIPGATSATYTPTAAVLGKELSVRVDATSPGYFPAFMPSGPSARVLAGIIRSTRSPSITGTRKVGRVLTARPGTWSVAGLTYRYQWLRDGHVITGARHRTYKVTARSKGHRISVRITAVRTAYTTATKTSAGTAKIG